MHHRLKRLLLVLFLTLALPVQGLAAVSAGLCMALEHHGEHHHSLQGHDGGHDHHGATGHASCGSCVGCCASVAIAGTGAAFSLPPAAAPAAAARVELTGVPPPPLDRPPLAR